eukprot:13418122-Alexandrium_andersonii.AAC.1
MAAPPAGPWSLPCVGEVRAEQLGLPSRVASSPSDPHRICEGTSTVVLRLDTGGGLAWWIGLESLALAS